MLILRGRMKFLGYGGIAAILLAGIVLASIPGSRRASEPMSIIGATTLESTRSVSADSRPEIAAPDNNVAHVEMLGRDLKFMTSKIAQLETQLALLGRDKDIGIQPRDASPQSTTREIPLGYATPDQTAPLERFRRFQAVMQSEQEDPRATAALQAAFQTAIADFEISSSVSGISCRETMCRVNSSHSGQEALDQFLRHFPAAVPWDMTAEIQYEPLSNGSSQTVIFVSMKNKTLPEM